MDTIFQSSYSYRPSEAVIGQLAEAFSPSKRTGRVARGLVKAGYGLFRAPSVGGAGSQMLDPGEAFQIPNPGAGADDDSIITAGTSATGTDLPNGAVGSAEFQPARTVQIVFDSSTDWDPTNGTARYLDSDGVLQNETVAIATSTTVTLSKRVRQFISFTKPAQTGTGGTYKIGHTALSALTAADFCGVAIRKPIKTTISGAGLYGYPGITSTLVTADYVDAESVPVLEAGAIWVFTEEAVVEGDPVYVRITSGAGGSNLGAFRKSADSASAVQVPGALFKRAANASGPAWATFPFYGL